MNLFVKKIFVLGAGIWMSSLGSVESLFTKRTIAWQEIPGVAFYIVDVARIAESGEYQIFISEKTNTNQIDLMIPDESLFFRLQLWNKFSKEIKKSEWFPLKKQEKGVYTDEPSAVADFSFETGLNLSSFVIQSHSSIFRTAMNGQLTLHLYRWQFLSLLPQASAGFFNHKSDSIFPQPVFQGFFIHPGIGYYLFEGSFLNFRYSMGIGYAYAELKYRSLSKYHLFSFQQALDLQFRFSSRFALILGLKNHGFVDRSVTFTWGLSSGVEYSL